jgi:hypothetical protein
VDTDARGCMVSVLRDDRDGDSARWPALTRSLVTAAEVASTAADLAFRQFQVAQLYVECDETGDPTLTGGAAGSRWVQVFSRHGWVPGTDTGQDLEVLSLTGLELTRRLPEGVGVYLDAGHPHGLVVIPAVASPVDVVRDADQAGGAGR